MWAATKEVKGFYVGVVGTFKTMNNEWQAVESLASSVESFV